MYARRVAEAVELAKARARSIMAPGAETVPADLGTAGAKPKGRPPRKGAPAPRNAVGKADEPAPDA